MNTSTIEAIVEHFGELTVSGGKTQVFSNGHRVFREQESIPVQKGSHIGIHHII